MMKNTNSTPGLQEQLMNGKIKLSYFKFEIIISQGKRY